MTTLCKNPVASLCYVSSCRSESLLFPGGRLTLGFRSYKTQKRGGFHDSRLTQRRNYSNMHCKFWLVATVFENHLPPSSSWPRTPGSQSGNRGSNPLGGIFPLAASCIKTHGAVFLGTCDCCCDFLQSVSGVCCPVFCPAKIR